MKKIEAILKPFKLDDVRDALATLGIDNMTVEQVAGAGRQMARPSLGDGGDIEVNLLPRLRLVVVVAHDRVAAAVEAIAAAAHTGRLGDGKIFVSPIDDVVRIRTGERGPSAL